MAPRISRPRSPAHHATGGAGADKRSRGTEAGGQRSRGPEAHRTKHQGRQSGAGQISASSATATKTIVRYVVDQWNSRIGLTASPRVARRQSRCASTTKMAPTTRVGTP